MKAIAHTYEDVKEDVIKVASKYARRRGVDRDECQGEANLYFVLAYHKYIQENGDFDRWVKYFVRMNLLERSRTVAKERAAREAWIAEKPPTDPEPHPVEKLLREVGEEAQELVGLLLSGPKGEGAKTALHRAKTVLLGRGVRAQVVEQLVREIQEAL